MLKRVREIWSLDVIDINFDKSNEPENILAKGTSAYYRCFCGAIRFLYILGVRSIGRGPRHEILARSSNKIWLYSASRNQLEALMPLAKEMSPIQRMRDDEDISFLHPAEVYWRSIPFLPALIGHFLASQDELRSRIASDFGGYWLCYGLYSAYLHALRLGKPKIVGISSDQSRQPRAMRLAAQHVGVPVFYLQHASIGFNEPVLDAELVFLNGLDAAEKYALRGNAKSTVYLTGPPKLDRLMASRIAPAGRTIGICSGLRDSFDNLIHLLEALTEVGFKSDIEIRAHPRDSRLRQWQILAEKHNIKLSESGHEPTIDFIQRCSVVIAGDSNILLESLACRIPSVHFDFGGNQSDQYGFFAAELVPFGQNCDIAVWRVKEALRGEQAVSPILGRYIATFGTVYAGFSGELVAEIVEAFLEGHSPDMATWQPVDEIDRFSTYRLRTDRVY